MMTRRVAQKPIHSLPADVRFDYLRRFVGHHVELVVAPYRNAEACRTIVGVVVSVARPHGNGSVSDLVVLRSIDFVDIAISSAIVRSISRSPEPTP